MHSIYLLLSHSLLEQGFPPLITKSWPLLFAQLPISPSLCVGIRLLLPIFESIVSACHHVCYQHIHFGLARKLGKCLLAYDRSIMRIRNTCPASCSFFKTVVGYANGSYYLIYFCSVLCCLCIFAGSISYTRYMAS